MSNDAFVFGVGNGATATSGPQTNTPASTVFTGLPVMGGVNQRSAPASSSITVNFPAPGMYPYEVDYAKGGDKNLTLTMRRADSAFCAADVESKPRFAAPGAAD